MECLIQKVQQCCYVTTGVADHYEQKEKTAAVEAVLSLHYSVRSSSKRASMCQRPSVHIRTVSSLRKTSPVIEFRYFLYNLIIKNFPLKNPATFYTNTSE